MDARANVRSRMTFGYVGYVWAIFGCSLVSLFFGAVAGVLYLIGRRVDRAAPRTAVEAVPLAGEGAPAGGGPAPSEPA